MIPNFSIRMLSYKSPKTLINTLTSYKNNGLLDLCKDFIIFFQAISQKDKEIADQFGLPYYGWSENMVPFDWRIKQAVDTINTKYMLFLENDWDLIEDKGQTEKQLLEAINLIESKKADVVRFRHRKNPGAPLYSWLQWGLREKLLWHKAKTHLMECVHWYKNPEQMFSEYIKKEGEYFFTDCRSVNYTNNPCLYETETFKSKLSPFFLEGQNIELRIEKEYWPSLNLTIAHGPGLFMHNRLDWKA